MFLCECESGNHIPSREGGCRWSCSLARGGDRVPSERARGTRRSCSLTRSTHVIVLSGGGDPGARRTSAIVSPHEFNTDYRTTQLSLGPPRVFYAGKGEELHSLATGERDAALVFPHEVDAGYRTPGRWGSRAGREPKIVSCCGEKEDRGSCSIGASRRLGIVSDCGEDAGRSTSVIVLPIFPRPSPCVFCRHYHGPPPLQTASGAPPRAPRQVLSTTSGSWLKFRRKYLERTPTAN